MSVTDANALRPAGSFWTVPGTVTANSVPAAGRVLLGGVQVRTDSNVLVRAADVIVEAPHTPLTAGVVRGTPWVWQNGRLYPSGWACPATGRARDAYPRASAPRAILCGLAAFM